MLHWSLLQHDLLWGSEESEFLTPIANSLRPAYELGRKFEPHSWLYEQQVNLPEFAQYLGKGIADLYASRSTGKRWVEQTPSYTLIAEELALLFPAAQFLLLIRDGRQVADSMRRMWHWDIERAATTWRQHTQAGLVLKERYPNRVLEIRYETIVSSPQQAFETIFVFLTIPYDARSAEFLCGKPINASPGTENQTHTDKLKPRWENWSWLERKAFRLIASSLLKQLGYN